MAAKKILYADDETTSRKILAFQLEKRGIQCDLAVDGHEALRKFREGSYDLVILDRYMPGMNGEDVAREILKLSPSVPLIAATADASEVEVLRRAGFREVLAKPLRGEAHLAIIDSYLAD